MIAVDTNIIVRFLTHDDAKQYRKAFIIFNTQDVFISNTVVLETKWVLRFAYKFSPADICHAFSNLFGLQNVALADVGAVTQAIEWHQSGLDFADALHLTQSNQCDKLVTFDKRFISKAKDLIACPVAQP
jgi:predicted nucleic-acid-binding protein